MTSKDKYIIRNCPCYFNKPEVNCWADQLSWCQNCTDCKMKQIVELCKGSIRENERDIYRAGRMSLAINILGLLDIQEEE